MTTGLFIGRFQPFHLGHLNDVKVALKECDELIIAIGSSQYSNKPDNPFSYEERKEMIEKVLKSNKIRNCRICPVTDINDHSRWVAHVKKSVPHFDIVYTANPFTEELFRKSEHDIKIVHLIEGINATKVRDFMKEGKEWKALVPKEVALFIEKIEGQKRMKGVHF